MLFFRTISLVAALAFATLSFAVPLEGSLVSSSDVFARDVALPVKRGGSGITGIYDNCHQSVLEIIVDINVAVNTGNHGDILIGLKKIIVQIDLLITGVQGYGQVDLDVSAFARTVFDLVQDIAKILIVVVDINADITDCIGEIGDLLGKLLHLTLGIVVGLDAVLVVLLQSIGGILGTLGYISIFISIGLSIPVSL